MNQGGQYIKRNGVKVLRSELKPEPEKATKKPANTKKQEQDHGDKTNDVQKEVSVSEGGSGLRD